MTKGPANTAETETRQAEAEIADPDEIVYRMPRKYQVYVALAMVAPQFAVSLWGAAVFARIDLRFAGFLLGTAVLMVAAVVVVARLFPAVTFVADRSGLRWSKRWHLPWEDIRAASVRSFLGVRWIVFHRPRGFRWTMWWSLPGRPDFVLEILPVVPEGNPLHECVRVHLSAKTPPK